MHKPYADSEVGRLRTVLLHRPGPELRRLTPRNSHELLFDGIPWVARAQDEHDAFAEALRQAGVDVLYVRELLAETLEVQQARADVVAAALAEPRLGHRLREAAADYLNALSPTELAEVLIAGLSRQELKTGEGLVYRLMNEHDFVINPLPNLLFTRDVSVWISDHVVVTHPATEARRREATLAGAIWRHHPRFAGASVMSPPSGEGLEGGDVLLLGPGVLAVGTGQRTSPAGVEWLARRVFAEGIAHTVLVVQISQERATMHLDTVCTMVDVDTVVMYPPLAETLTAYRVTPHGDGGLDMEPARPFLEVAAESLGIETLRVIDTGLDPITAEREQWDDGNNTLCLAPRLAVAYERNTETNARLEAAGISVVRIAGSELASGRGGPRCLSCPIQRDSRSE